MTAISESPIVSIEKIWEEIRAAYNTAFLDELLAVPGMKVYAFGGIVTDLSLGEPWKDLDLRIIHQGHPLEETAEIVSKILERHTTIIQKVEFPGGVVIRVKIAGGKDMIIDIGISDGFAVFRADFKACAIFIDLATGEVVELSESCVDDFKHHIIRPLDEPETQLEADPTHLFRALKFAAKSGFTINPEFERLLKKKKSLARRAVADVVAYLKGNGKDSISEYYLGNIFGGLKKDAVLYTSLLQEYGFFDEICVELQELVCDEKMPIRNMLQPEAFRNKNSLEERLSLFLSAAARSISGNPESCFEALKSAFALDTARSDGNEFAVDPKKIAYVA